MHEHIRVTVLGGGSQAERWAAALEPHADVSLAPEEASEADAVVVGPGALDAFAAAKRALARGVPVLYAAPFSLSPWQAALLDALSGRTGVLLRFAEPFQHLGGFRFLGRLTRGREPLWQLRYLRTMSAGEDGARLEALAIEELAACQALIDLPPVSVTAAAAQRDELGGICALFLTVTYPGGVVAQCTISLVEPEPVRQLVAVTRTRTVVMDRLNPDAPLEVTAVAEGASKPRPRRIAVPPLDPVAEEGQRFARAVAEGHRAHSNSERWVRIAALWWAARQSMSFGGMIEVPAPRVVLGQSNTEPPPLRVIAGGGRVMRAAKRPQLTLIAS